AAIQLGVAALAAEAFDLRDGHSRDADLRQRGTDVVEFEGLDDCADEFHSPGLLSRSASNRKCTFYAVAKARGDEVAGVAGCTSLARCAFAARAFSASPRASVEPLVESQRHDGERDGREREQLVDRYLQLRQPGAAQDDAAHQLDEMRERQELR